MPTVEQMLERLYQCCCTSNKLLAQIVNMTKAADTVGMIQDVRRNRSVVEYCVLGQPLGTFYQVTLADRFRICLILSPHSATIDRQCISLRNTAAGPCNIEARNTQIFTLADHGPLVWGEWYAQGENGCDVIAVNYDQQAAEPSFQINFRRIDYD